MGIFDFLFGSKPARQAEGGPISTARTATIRTTFKNGIMTINEIDFFGLFEKSPSGEWVIGWHEPPHGEGRQGRYALYNIPERKVYAQGGLERPNSGHVADNGTFCLEDWLFGEGLNGTFYAFDNSGQILIKRKFEANIFNSGVSRNGLLAICQTANNRSHDDGNQLAGFDLKAQEELFAIHAQTGWADKYDFLEEQGIFTVILNKIGKFQYDRAGEFLDHKCYETARLKTSRFDVALPAAEEILNREQIDSKLLETVLSAIRNARSVGADDNPSWKSQALKLEGIALESLGRGKEALVVYDEALAINPKIGVKRRADALRKTV